MPPTIENRLPGRAVAWLLLLVFARAGLAQIPQATAFVYQGELRQNGAAVSASVDAAFALFDTDGNAVGPALAFTSGSGNALAVQNGIFSVVLDFGALPFSSPVSEERYLQVTINGDVLAPRTRIENAPYALQARTAELAYNVSNASVGSAQIVAAQVQQRVAGSCPAGSSIQAIAQSGTVTCQSAGNGTVTSIASGNGLTGGPVTGSGTLAIANGGVGLTQINNAQVQARVTGSCNAAQKLLGINADGSVACGGDATGGTGTVTSVASGTGLAGGPISTTGTLSIADGGVGVAQINTAQVQSRINGMCALGEYVRGVNADGSLVCAPVLGAQRITTVDWANSVGQSTSIAIGADAMPVVSYYDQGNGAVRIAHCADAACVGTAAVTTIDGVGNIGSYGGTSLTIGADSLPVVSYHDLANGHLKVAHCSNAACTASTTTTVDTGSNVGAQSSIGLGTDGLPVISYCDQGNGDLKVAHCQNAACSGSATITTVDSTGNVGSFSSLRIGTDSVPVVSYYDTTNGDLKVAHCANAACTGAAAVTTVDAAGNVGIYSSMAIGADGFPVVSYSDYSNKTLKVAHCANLACSGSALLSIVDSGGIVGYFTAAAIGADGLPIVSYYDNSNGDLKVAHCANAACSNATTTSAVDASGIVGAHSAIAIGSDGLPVISYYDGTNGHLKVLKCNNRFCQ